MSPIGKFQGSSSYQTAISYPSKGYIKQDGNKGRAHKIVAIKRN